jgi:hypothetical protein
MTIASIITAGKGRSHGWEVREYPSTDEGTELALVHFGTRLLVWQRITKEILYKNIGWGSVSDANGINTAFLILDAPYWFLRDRKGGGPRFIERKMTASYVPVRGRI